MRQRIKSISAIFLSMVIIISTLAMPVSAFAKNDSSDSTEFFQKGKYTMHKNPFYEGKELSYSTLDDVSATTNSVTKVLDSTTYYSDGKQLYTIVRDNLEKRKETFTIHYLTTNVFFAAQVNNELDKMLYYASEDELSVSCTDGDYIRWSVCALGNNTALEPDAYSGGYLYYTIEARFDYYSTAAQEAEVDKVVNNFVANIDTNSLTDYQVIKEIHDFICDSTTYDDDAIDYLDRTNDLGPYKYAWSSYGAFLKGACVCQGYAVAFYRLCKELGYSVRFVSSYGHAWNIVGLDGKYYFVDATWDDGAIDEGDYDEAYYYFLVNYSTLRSQDQKLSNEQYEAHYLEDYYETEYFWENYRNYFDTNNYNPNNKNLLSQAVISISNSSYTYTGSEFKPTVNVRSSGSAPSYRIVYSKNKDTGFAAVNLCSSNGSRILSHRNFIIIPKKMGSLSLADSGRGTDSIKVKWSKAPGAVTGYKIEVYKNGKWNVVKTLSGSTTSYKVPSLSASTQYKFRIRSYVNISKRTYYGAYSNTYINATKPKTPSASSISTKSKSVTLKWKKVTCSGYEIQYSLSSSMSKPTTKTASASSTSKTISKLKKGKKYYVRVRAYKTYTDASGKKVKCYSSWSSKKSIKCK